MNSEVFYKNINNQQVFCVHDYATEDSNKIVVFSHGFRSSSLGPARQFVQFSRLLNRNGIEAFRFDQPKSGNSQGKYVNSSFNEWIATTTTITEDLLRQGYQVALMGQSMGATCSGVVSADPELQHKLKALLLWVPDPKSKIKVDPEKIYVEGGQQYRGVFWEEAKKADLIGCLKKFDKRIHLVYGENDRYVKKELRELTIDTISKKKNGEVMVLEGEDHSPWSSEHVDQVFNAELSLLKKAFSA
jgi:pimeloyl-ACP methyl ester carboxylesterase